MIQSLNLQFLGMILYFDLESLFKLCDAIEICVGFQFQSWKIKSFTNNVYLANNLFEKLSIHHFTQIVVAWKEMYSASF